VNPSGHPWVAPWHHQTFPGGDTFSGVGMLWGWDVLELGPFVLGCSVVGRFVLGCFVRAPQEGTLNVEKEQRTG
jgi:hypothetical protein